MLPVPNSQGVCGQVLERGVHGQPSCSICRRWEAGRGGKQQPVVPFYAGDLAVPGENLLIKLSPLPTERCHPSRLGSGVEGAWERTLTRRSSLQRWRPPGEVEASDFRSLDVATPGLSSSGMLPLTLTHARAGLSLELKAGV